MKIAQQPLTTKNEFHDLYSNWIAFGSEKIIDKSNEPFFMTATN